MARRAEESTEELRIDAHLNQADEEPLREWLAGSGARLLRAFSPAFPLEQVAWSSLQQVGRDECLAIWYEDVFRPHELAAEFSRDFGGLYFDSWDLPVIIYQRQWYRKHGTTIFEISWECSYRSFRLGWPEEAFLPDQIADFERRLALLREHFAQLRRQMQQLYLPVSDGSFLARGAVEESDELRQFEGHYLGL